MESNKCFLAKNHVSSSTNLKFYRENGFIFAAEAKFLSKKLVINDNRLFRNDREKSNFVIISDDFLLLSFSIGSKFF